MELIIKNKNIREGLSRLIVHLVLITMGLLFMLPFIWMVSTSLKPNTQIFTRVPVIIPDPVKWSNYPDAVNYIPMARYFFNTMKIMFFCVIGITISCPLAGYGFSKIKWPGRDIVFIIVLATMMLPQQVRMIPLFILFSKAGWVNTHLPLIVPAFFGNAFYIFLLRQFFMTLPDDLRDAAKIDGCSEFGIFSRVMLPLAKPAVATILLFEIMFVWHDFLRPLIYLNGQEMYTLALGLQQYFTLHGAEWGLMMAAATLFTLPIIIIFFFAQRQFIEGISMTGMKG